MVYGFNGLWHYAIVSCYHQDGNIRYIGSVSSHGGKGFMTGGIQEGNLLPINSDLIGTDVLSDAPGFGIHDIGLSYGIK